MARCLTCSVVLMSALLLVVVVSMCAPGGADAARLLGTEVDAAVAVAVPPLAMGRLQAHEEMTTTALQVPVPGDVEAGEDGSGAAASERLSRGGPDPQHH